MQRTEPSPGRYRPRGEGAAAARRCSTHDRSSQLLLYRYADVAARAQEPLPRRHGRQVGLEVGAVRYRGVVSGRRDESIAQLEEQLDGAARTMSGLDQLNAREADRVAARMDRLASQLLEISPPPAMEGLYYQRLGLTPASDEDFALLVERDGRRQTAKAEWPRPLRRLEVRFDEAVWREAIRGFSREPLQIATSARLAAERHGVALAEVLPCEAARTGRDSPRRLREALPGRPATAPPSERPYAFVFQLTRAANGGARVELRRLRSPPPEVRCAKRLRTRAPSAPRSIP